MNLLSIFTNWYPIITVLVFSVYYREQNINSYHENLIVNISSYKNLQVDNMSARVPALREDSFCP